MSLISIIIIAIVVVLFAAMIPVAKWVDRHFEDRDLRRYKKLREKRQVEKLTRVLMDQVNEGPSEPNVL